MNKYMISGVGSIVAAILLISIAVYQVYSKNKSGKCKNAQIKCNLSSYIGIVCSIVLFVVGIFLVNKTDSVGTNFYFNSCSS